MERIINTLLGAIAAGVIIGFALGVLVGYGWRGLRQMDRDMKRAQLDQEKHERKKQRPVSYYGASIPVKSPDESIFKELLDQRCADSFYQAYDKSVEPTNYLDVPPEDIERIRQNILDKMFPPTPEPESGTSPLDFAQQQHDDQIVHRLLASLDSSEPNGGDA